MKKIKISLLGKVVIAIAAGILFGQFLPASIVRIFVTFNSLFGNFLSYIQFFIREFPIIFHPIDYSRPGNTGYR